MENFWETGYGMPSFTLLGPTVIRFPFILTSSYPHEILHNWWGNSVFVDYSTGNWCEGLTAYMADHLIQEQRGKGEDYRRGTLQKYRNYVKESRDFPLSEFRSRHSAATEAVGYGKTLMGFHMLRLYLGDEDFRSGLATFYRRFRGQRASFGDLQAVLEDTSGKELGWFFQPWVERPGAAAFEVEVEPGAEATTIRGRAATGAGWRAFRARGSGGGPDRDRGRVVRRSHQGSRDSLRAAGPGPGAGRPGRPAVRCLSVSGCPRDPTFHRSDLW